MKKSLSVMLVDTVVSFTVFSAGTLGAVGALGVAIAHGAPATAVVAKAESRTGAPTSGSDCVKVSSGNYRCPAVVVMAKRERTDAVAKNEARQPARVVMASMGN